jgi:hypothetical protein
MLLNRKLVLLIACICLFLSVTTLQDTYAKYTSSVDETTDISIARWRILVNNFDVRSSATTSNLITPVFAGNNNIASGVIAPTATGYFEVIIDATGTDLSFNYTIDIGNSEDSIVSDVRVTGCSMNGAPLVVTNGQVTGTIRLSDQRVNRMIVYIEWLDGDGETMDNADDTNTTMAAESVAKISVNANFIQIAS